MISRPVRRQGRGRERTPEQHDHFRLTVVYDMLGVMDVRQATVEDADSIVQILAVVAQEGLIATEPPVDVPTRTERVRAMLAQSAPADQVINANVTTTVAVTSCSPGSTGMSCAAAAIATTRPPPLRRSDCPASGSARPTSSPSWAPTPSA